MRLHKTQAQIFITFAFVHIILSMAAGFCWWYLADAGMRNQAARNAESVAKVISQGGFTLNDKILQRMQDISTYTFTIVDDGPDVTAVASDTGVVIVPFADQSGQSVCIYYLNKANVQTLVEIFWTSIALVIAGTLLFLPVAWFLARRFARPLETLSQSAQRIGGGDWDQPVHVSGTTESYNLGQQLEKMRLQLQALDAKHRQAEHLATLGTFTATIAHEVRNPLSSVRLLIQMLMKEHDDQRLAHVEQELQRLDLIVDELLGFSAGMQIQIAECNLYDMATYVISLLQRQADHADVAVELKTLVADGTCVLADQRRMQQLLMNLLLNAIQAQQVQEDQGLVVVEICSDGFAVYDDGPGVPESIRETLFTPFVSAKESGTGLGLHLARSVAEAHDATLSYQREQQTCFRLSGLRSKPCSTQ